MRRAGGRWICVGFESCCYYSGGVFPVCASAYPPRALTMQWHKVRSRRKRKAFVTLINSHLAFGPRWILQGISQARRRVIVDVNDGFFLVLFPCSWEFKIFASLILFFCVG